MAKIDRGPSRNMDDLSREDKSESGDGFLGLEDVCPVVNSLRWVYLDRQV